MPCTRARVLLIQLPRSSWFELLTLITRFRCQQASGPVKALEVFRKKLPAFQMKTELLEAVKNNQVSRAAAMSR